MSIRIHHFIICCLLFLLSCQNSQNEETKGIKSFPSDPNNTKLITSDIDLFWKYFDLQLKDTTTNSFEQYLIEGSIGLKDFIPDRIESATELKSLVLAEQEYYQNIRASSYRVLSFEKQIKASFYALEYLYPKAEFPPIYFLIGRTTSGGTASKNGLMIALEIYSDNNYTTSYGRPSLNIDILPNIVIHELIHFLQKDDINDESLLKNCIREGSADFIAELVSGEKVKYANGPNVYLYGNSHERELWLEFKDSMNTNNLDPWLYSPTNDGRPQNLGYWMGYKIVESYYEKSENKSKAIDDILNIKNYIDFLEDSHYSDKFK